MGEQQVTQKELPYFDLEGAYGGWQVWFPERWMRIGGCAAVTACDVSIYLALYRGLPQLYPFDLQHLTRADYVRFGMMMKPYLRPRYMGVDKLSLFIEGFGGYLYDRGVTLSLVPWEGEHEEAATVRQIRRQIDAGLPIPCLLLRHQALAMQDYTWHWFLLTGYLSCGGQFFVKVVTYGSWRWLDFHLLWQTGYTRKGGLVLLRD